MSDIQQPYYAVCKLGQDRFFWYAMAGYEAICNDDPPLGYGYAPTRDQAEQAARVAAGPDAVVNPNGWASEYHRRMGIKKRMGQQSDASGAEVQEFLYMDWMDDMSSREYSIPHRVVKKTATYVYIDKRRYDPDHRQTGKWYDFDIQTIRLDRATLERDGSAWSRVERDRFYTTPVEQRQPYSRAIPACLVTLGLSYPCQVEDVKRAYRQLAKQHHPDTGGDAIQFQAIQAAYEQALRVAA